MKFRAGCSGNPQGGKPRLPTAAEIERIAQLVAEGANRTAICKALDCHRRTLLKWMRTYPRIGALLEPPPPLTEEQLALIEKLASQSSDDVIVARAFDLDVAGFRRLVEGDPRVVERTELGRARLKRHLIRKLCETDHVAGAIYLLKALFGLADTGPQVNVDLRGRDFSKMSDEELYAITGRSPPAESPPSVERSSVPHPYSTTPPTSPSTALALRTQPAVVVRPSPVIQHSPITLEGRAVAHRPAARTLKGLRIAERKREQARILASGGGFTRSMSDDED